MTDHDPALPSADLRFSVIVPTYNRAGMILRAVGSVLASGRDDYEVIVIDDCSTDDTAAVIEALGDPRVRLVRQAVNRGVCEARNAGIDAARGRWMVMLDSDFELLPGGLDRLAARCDAAPADVGNVTTVCRWDRGPDTPDPTPTESALLDLPAYLHFIATRRVSEWFNCYRREVFGVLRYPGGRAYESSFHLAAATRWRFWMCVDRVVLIHTDASCATRRTGPPTPTPCCAGGRRCSARTSPGCSRTTRPSGLPSTCSRATGWRPSTRSPTPAPRSGARPASGPSSRSDSSGRAPSRTRRPWSPRSSAASAGAERCPRRSTSSAPSSPSPRP